MRNIRLLMEYDGTRYDGWQRLGKNSGKNTIQGKLEDVLSRMTGEAVEISASGADGCRRPCPGPGSQLSYRNSNVLYGYSKLS